MNRARWKMGLLSLAVPLVAIVHGCGSNDVTQHGGTSQGGTDAGPRPDGGPGGAPGVGTCTAPFVSSRIPTGKWPELVATADLDGDGKTDLVAVAYLNGLPTVHVMLAQGPGAFAPRVDYPISTDVNIGWAITDVIVADLTGDGKPEVALTRHDGKSLHFATVLVNHGDGTFGPPVDYAVGASPLALVATDVDGDGKLDLVVPNSSDDTVSVLVNHGDGTFTSKVDYPTGKVPSSVAAVDLNGDGKPEIVVTNEWDDSLSVLVNQGGGTFASKVDHATGGGPASVVATDLDGDGKPDIVVANIFDLTLSTFRNNGDGTLAPLANYPQSAEPGKLALVDLRGAGRPDVLVLYYNHDFMSVFQAPGDGSLAGQVDYAVARGNTGVAPLDMNGDGHVDLVFGHDEEDGGLRQLWNKGDGTLFFTQAELSDGLGGYPAEARVLDLNADGWPDIAFRRDDGIAVRFNHHGSGFSPLTPYPSPDSVNGVAFGDLDGDGTPDLVTAMDGAVGVRLNDGKGGFGSRADAAVSGPLIGIAAGDLDGDGKADVVATKEGTAIVLVGDGHGHLTKKAEYAAAAGQNNPVAELSNNNPVLADVNGDGKLDIVTLDGSVAKLSVLLNHGDGTFAARVDYPAGQPATYAGPLVAADVNGDGLLDIATANKDTCTVTILFNKGDGTLGSGVDIDLESTMFCPIPGFALVDTNGSGSLDLVLTDNVQTVILLNRGDGTFADQVVIDVPGSAGVEVSDLNRDGKPDLVAASSHVALMINSCSP